ncbi:hypothetical protein C3747_21g120 [Trypanosoma cruzi]|uniref:Calponin-homology (CH) domain-containing protein n=2 Tax=Trypanosoma cruzi TaxID=5693 RepID=Q4CRS1_TRYCC|nr:hypothetical protein, conserved [Trypanosoma cruzi]EAN82972.1 hypothetical protein, conserved [Trypanosoma cruzi]PWV16848.1 hypothetical protein C3747_21g120 [Trypanosoma cruzi]|eukprot:XP_804823.1 hypothetical protein [Trypanosoma cruzi strain CL Brener]
MHGTSAAVQPSGRGELLLWINSVCTAQYPSVESLRDGVAYCTIVDAVTSRVAENCTALGLPEAKIAQSRAKRASLLLSRVEWGVTTVTCINQDPSSDTLQERGHCEKNMQTLQFMLRGCVPQEFSLEVDVTRLAAGKLQEHIMLLKWMYQFLKKMLNTYSRSALERRANTSEGAGHVEGVRPTRAMKLQQKMVREKYMELDFAGPVPNNETKNNEVETSMREDPTFVKDIKNKNKSQAIRMGSFPTIVSGAVDFSEDEGEVLPKFHVEHLDETSKENRHVCNRNSQLNIDSNGSHFFLNLDIESLFLLPQECLAVMEDMRREVESYEAITLAAYRHHQHCLTGSKDEQESYFTGGCSINEELLLKKAPIISLEQLGLLLEERDKLWQTLEVLQNVLLRNLTGLIDGIGSTNSASPLIKKILLALSPL